VKGAVKSYYRLRRRILPVIFDTDLSPCRASIQPMSQQRADGWHGCYACFAAPLSVAYIPDHSMNS